MKFIVDLWLDGYDDDEEMKQACIEFIQEALDSSASSVSVEIYEETKKETEDEMHTGMLWFDNSQTALNIKIQKAVDYYHKKYGRTPDLCLVHPSMLDGRQDKIETSTLKITVRPYRPVLPGHIWVGIEDKN